MSVVWHALCICVELSCLLHICGNVCTCILYLYIDVLMCFAMCCGVDYMSALEMCEWYGVHGACGVMGVCIVPVDTHVGRCYDWHVWGTCVQLFAVFECFACALHMCCFTCRCVVDIGL